MRTGGQSGLQRCSHGLILRATNLFPNGRLPTSQTMNEIPDPNKGPAAGFLPATSPTGQSTAGFGATSTTNDALEGVDLRGQRILVTGVSAGIGVETARALAAHGARVIGAARNLDKARAATEPARAQAAPHGGLDLVELDLASLASIRACADGLLATGKPFDLIIANAGVMAAPQGTTADGFETQFGTNHLGHFVLINRLTSLLKPGGRVVSLSSAGHRAADVDLEDPNFERTPYNELTAYRRSKTANILFAMEFDRRHRPGASGQPPSIPARSCPRPPRG